MTGGCRSGAEDSGSPMTGGAPAQKTEEAS